MNRERVAVAVALAAVAAFAALGGRTSRDSVPRRARGGAENGASARALSAPCPPGTLPDDGVCVPVPAAPAGRERAAPEGIPRRPDRDPDYARYEWPVQGLKGTSVEPSPTTFGMDGGRARSGVMMSAKAGAEIRAVWLEGQEGPATVVYAGPLLGGSVMTLHLVNDPPRKQEYLVVLGDVGQGPALAPHAALSRGASVGVATLTPVYLDVRRMRAGTDAWALAPSTLTDEANSVPVDPRNVLVRVP